MMTTLEFDVMQTVPLAEFLLTWWAQSAVLIVIGLIAALALRGRGAAAQSAVYRLTLAAVLLCPLLSSTLSRSGTSLTFDLLPTSNTPHRAATLLPPKRPLPDDMSIAREGNESAVEANAEKEQPTATPANSAASTSTSPATLLPLDSSSTQPVVPAPTTEASSTSSLPVAYRLALAIWFAGTLFLWIRLLVEFIGTRSLQASSTEADWQAKAICGQVAHELRVKRPEVFVTPFISSPCLIGHFKPVVLLPDDTPAECYREVFLHELAHLRRGDWLCSVIGRAVAATLWAQPLLWWLLKRISVSAEEVCDDYVLHHGGNRNVYVESLVEVAEHRLPQRPVVGVAMISFKSALARRAGRILDQTREISTTAGAAFTCWAGASMLVLTAIVGACCIGSPGRVSAQQPGENASAPSAETSADSTKKLVFAGQVFLPDGKPAVGAEVFETFLTLSKQKDSYSRLVATTDEHGRFEFESEQISRHRNGVGSIVIKQQGYAVHGLLAAAVEKSGKLKELFREKKGAYQYFKDRLDYDSKPVRLIPDDVTITGRIIDLEGKGLAGATITIRSISTGRDRTLAAFEKLAGTNAATYPGINATLVRLMSGATANLAPIKSDEAGRFSISGIGKNRLVGLLVEGKNIQTQLVHARTNGGPKRTIPMGTEFADSWNFTYFGDEVSVVAAPCRPLIGKVTDKETGQPIAGAVITSMQTIAQELVGDKIVHSRAGSEHVRAVSDAEGNYRLDGLPPARRTPISVTPSGGSYLVASIFVDTRGKAGQPVQRDIRLSKGLVVSGRVVNSETGEGVRGEFKYFSDAGDRGRNSFRSADQRQRSDEKGEFRIVVPRKKGTLCFRAFDSHRYTFAKTPKAAFDPFAATSVYNLTHKIELPAKQDSLDSLTLNLQPSRSIAGSAVAPDGSPAKKLFYAGRVASYAHWKNAEEGRLELLGIGEGQTRNVYALDQQRQLAGWMQVNGDQDGFKINLQKCAKVTGRLVDEDGQPLTNIHLQSRMARRAAASPAMAMRSQVHACPLPPTDRYGNPNQLTDGEGRFTLAGMVPGYAYDLDIRYKPSLQHLDPKVVRGLELEPGETRDLGDIVLKRRAANPR